MQYCNRCGKVLFDEEVFCSGCGYFVSNSRMSRKKKTLYIIGSMILLVAIVLSVLFMPRDIELDDLTNEPNKLICLLKFGAPTDVEGDEWHYRDKMEFYGTEVELVIVDFSDNTYSVLDMTNEDEITDTVKRYCKRKSDRYYTKYSYENLEITDWGFGIHVEVFD